MPWTQKPAAPVDPAVARRNWAERYLSGLARAYRRGNIPERAILGAIRLARSRQLELERVSEVLASHGLAWDSTTNCLLPLVEENPATGLREDCA